MRDERGCESVKTVNKIRKVSLSIYNGPRAHIMLSVIFQYGGRTALQTSSLGITSYVGRTKWISSDASRLRHVAVMRMSREGDGLHIIYTSTLGVLRYIGRTPSDQP